MRLIDADELKTAFPSGETIRTESVKATINHMPTAKKTGKWAHGNEMPPMKYKNGKPIKFLDYFLYCSSCGHEAYCDSDWGDQLFDFCPYCGAKMEEE